MQIPEQTPARLSRETGDGDAQSPIGRESEALAVTVRVGGRESFPYKDLRVHIGTAPSRFAANVP